MIWKREGLGRREANPPPTKFPLPLLENLLSQIFFQRYNSNLPTSLTNFLPSTRGFSPWVPDAVVGTNRWRGAHCSSIFQDAIGDSDENKSYFRFLGISRISPNDLIAILEEGFQRSKTEERPKQIDAPQREKTNRRKNQPQRQILLCRRLLALFLARAPPPFSASAYCPYQEKKTLPKFLLHVSRCRFVADSAPPFLSILLLVLES